MSYVIAFQSYRIQRTLDILERQARAVTPRTLHAIPYLREEGTAGSETLFRSASFPPEGNVVLL